MKIILWIFFIGTLSVMQFKNHILQGSGWGIIELEFADPSQGTYILSQWKGLYFGDISLLETAVSHTNWDFAFIMSYVLLIFVLSNWQMQRESLYPLNELLRFNLFAVSIAGLLDFIENVRLLHNFHHPHDVGEYWNTQIIAGFKFALVGITIVVFLISWLKGLFVKKISL